MTQRTEKFLQNSVAATYGRFHCSVETASINYHQRNRQPRRLWLPYKKATLINSRPLEHPLFIVYCQKSKTLIGFLRNQFSVFLQSMSGALFSNLCVFERNAWVLFVEVWHQTVFFHRLYCFGLECRGNDVCSEMYLTQLGQATRRLSVRNKFWL